MAAPARILRPVDAGPDLPGSGATGTAFARAAALPDVAYVIDPRFQGGTSAAVAAELRALAGQARIRVHAIESRMFAGRNVAPVLATTLADLRLAPDWDSPVISGDLVLLHNPSFLRFDTALERQILARHLAVVTHENFVRPGEAESHDVGGCLSRIDAAAVALRKSIAPVSPRNRRTVRGWLDRNPRFGHWELLAADWFNIVEGEPAAPSPQPRDRRGRLSRPGPEKFPPLATLDLCFPPTAEANVILGADFLAEAAADRPHWECHPFNGLGLADFFARIDFLVYFTAPTWSESFGRVLAEAVMAGKIVLTDAGTAAALPGAAIAARPDEVDGLIAAYLADPGRYAADVRRAQRALAAFAPEAFRRQFAEVAGAAPGVKGGSRA